MEEPIAFRTVVKSSLILFGLFLIVIYLIFQARFLIVGPKINLVNAPTLLQNERQVVLSGTTHNISHIWLNNRPIFTDAKGNFIEVLVLENGLTAATLRAQDRYGRTTAINQQFFYAPVSFATN